MSEQNNPTLNGRSAQFAKALGAEESIYIGPVNVFDIGGTRFRIQEARRAIDRGDVIFNSALEGLNNCILPENIFTERLSPRQHAQVIDVIERLETIKASPRQGRTPQAVCFELFDTYLEYRNDLNGTTPGYILRGIGDNVAVQYGLDPELAWEIYQAAVLNRENQNLNA